MSKTEEKIDFFVRTSLPPVEGVFYDGQIFDAHVFVSDLIKTAKKRIVLVDNYLDESVLVTLSKREPNVTAKIITKTVSNQFQLDLNRHNSQYLHIEVVERNNIHDRFLIIDEMVYHIGASLKDLGKKLRFFENGDVSRNDFGNNCLAKPSRKTWQSNDSSPKIYTQKYVIIQKNSKLIFSVFNKNL